MAYKLPRIEAAIQMVDNVSSVMRGVRTSVESVNGPLAGASATLGRFQNAMGSLSREAGLTKLSGAFAQTRKDFSGVADGAMTSFRRLGGVLLGAGGVVGAMGALVNSTAHSQAGLYLTAKRVGLTATGLRNLRYAAQVSGVEVETADSALQRFSKSVAEARAGTGNALGPMQAMGIRMKNSRGEYRAQEDILLDVAEAMSKLKDQQDRNRVAFALFGRGNLGFVNVLGQGKKALLAQFAEIMKIRGPVSETALENAHAFEIAKVRMSMAMSGLKSAFAAPLISAFADSTTQVMQLVEANRPLVKQFGQMVASALPQVLQASAMAFQEIVKYGKPVAEVLGAILKVLGPTNVLFVSVGWFVGGPLVKSLIQAAMGLWKLGGAIESVAKIALDALPALATFVMETLVPAIYSIGTALLTTPVGWIVAGLAAVAGAAYLIWKNWDAVSGFLMATWSKVSGFLDTSIGKILAVFVAPMIGIPLLIIKHWSTVSAFLVSLWDGVVAFFGTTFGKVVAVFVAPMIAIPLLIWQNWSKLTEWFGEIWDTVSSFLDTGVGQALALLVPFIGIPLLIVKNWEPLRKFFVGLWGAIGRAFSSFVDFMGNLWTSLNALVSHGASAISKALEGIPLVGSFLSKGVGFFQNTPTAGASGPPAASGALGAVRTNTDVSSSTILQRSTLDVNFNGLPAGARVGEPKGNAPVSVSTGMAFQGAM